MSVTQPVVHLSTGMIGTSSPSCAHQSANGPNAMISITFNNGRSGRFGGWGTYCAIVSTGSWVSGGFCFRVVRSSQTSGRGPTCTATLTVAGPTGPITSSAPEMPGQGSFQNVASLPMAVAVLLRAVDSGLRAQRIA